MSIDSSSKFWVSELEKRWTRIEDGTITIAATGAEEAPTRDMRVGMPVVVERVVEQRDWRLDDDWPIVGDATISIRRRLGSPFPVEELLIPFSSEPGMETEGIPMPEDDEKIPLSLEPMLEWLAGSTNRLTEREDVPLLDSEEEVSPFIVLASRIILPRKLGELQAEEDDDGKEDDTRAMDDFGGDVMVREVVGGIKSGVRVRVRVRLGLGLVLG